MDKLPRKVESICRLCLKEDENQLIPASELMNDTLSVQDIERFTGIQIEQNECIVCAICNDCVEKLKSSIVFRTLCMNNDGLFRHLLALPSKEGPISIKLSSKDGTNTSYEMEEPCMKSCSGDFQSDINIEILGTVGPEANSCPPGEYVFEESTFNADAVSIEEHDRISNSSLEEGDINCNSNDEDYLSNGELEERGENLKDNDPKRDLHGIETSQLSYTKVQRNYRRFNACGKTVSDLKSHMIAHTQHHIRTVHVKNTSKTRSPCGETFSSYDAYKYHKSSLHGNQEYETECNICSKKFANITSYNIHYGRYHATGVERNRPKMRRKQLCGECGIMVTQLSTHSLTHNQKKHLACPHCPIKMADKGNLLRHIQAVHLKKVVRTCEPCSKEFLHVNLYKYHMLSVHGIGKTFDCDVCLKKFKTLAGLKIHKVSLHSNEKRFECGTCGMMFKVKHTLRTHEKRVHSAEKPFACSQCPKRFKSPYGKKSHELTHSGIVFACALCEKSYRYKSLLQTHMKKQHSSMEEINTEH